MVRVKGERTIWAALKLYSRVKMVEEHKGTRPADLQYMLLKGLVERGLGERSRRRLAGDIRLDTACAELKDNVLSGRMPDN